MEFTKEQIELVASVMKEMGLTQKNDPASTTITAPTLHGTFPGNSAQYGIFSNPGIRPDMLSTLARPRSLTGAIIQSGGFGKSFYERERLEVLTGVTAASGTNATGWCGDPPTVGQGKVAELDYDWGEFYTKTNLNAVPKIGGRRDYADVNRNIVNAGPNANPLIPSLYYEMAAGNDQLQYELYLLGVHMELVMGKTGIQGDTTLASTETEVGFISEYAGLDSMVKTGYTDAKTGIAAPALDSIVTTFGADVGSTIGGGDGRNIVQAVSDSVWSAKDRARAYGLDGAQMAISMRPEMWRPFCQNYAYQYNIYGSSTTVSGISLNDNLRDTNNLRIEMERSITIPVDGEPIAVVFDEGIPRTQTAANTWYSDIFGVPLAWNGFPLLRYEYFDMDNADLQKFANFIGDGKYATMNNGLYLASYRWTGMCLEYHFACRMRLILEAPFLAFRLDDVHYTTRTQQRLADPSDTHFYADGGRTYRTG